MPSKPQGVVRVGDSVDRAVLFDAAGGAFPLELATGVVGDGPERVGEVAARVLCGGVPQIGVHGLRHSAATFMIASGVNPKVVQQRLGHANVSVTLGLYTHVLPAHDREAAALLGKALGDIP
jgi:integrase